MRRVAPALLLVFAAGCQAVLGITDTTRAGDASVVIDEPDAPPPADAIVDAVDGPLPDAPAPPDTGLPDVPLPPDAPPPDAPRPDAAPPDAAPDAPLPPDAAPLDAPAADASQADACTVCQLSRDCSAAKPICGGCACQLCSTDGQCAQRAAQVGDDHVLCRADGQCSECKSDGDCGGLTPICDAASAQCIAPPTRACGSAHFPGSGTVAAPALDVYDVTGSFTIEAWIYVTAYPSNSTTIVAHGEGPGTFNGGAYGLAIGSGGSAEFFIWDGTNYDSATTFEFTFVNLDEWTHLAGTFDGDTQIATLWLNGTKQETRTLPVDAPALFPTAALNVGGSAEQPYSGYIDEVRIAPGVLYTADFQPERYFASIMAEEIAHFHFDEAGSSYAIDVSPQHNDGKLVNGATFDPTCQYYRCSSVVTYGGYVWAGSSPAFEPPGAFTLEAYVQPQDLSGFGGDDRSHINIVDRATFTNNQLGYHLFVETATAHPGFEVSCDGSLWYTALSASPLRLTHWTHLAGTFDVSRGHVYLFQDGVQVAQSPALVNCAKAYDNSLPLIVASGFHNFGPYRGLIDELRLSKVVRYSSDFSSTVFEIPGAELPVDGNALALYHYDDDAIDSAGGNDATLYSPGVNVNFDTRCF
jgi:concanavalin A-like lectin/glucanase superfamily protein